MQASVSETSKELPLRLVQRCILLHLLAKLVEQIRRNVLLHHAAVDVRQLQRARVTGCTRRIDGEGMELGCTLMKISRKCRILMTSAGISSCFSLLCVLWNVTTLRMYLRWGGGGGEWRAMDGGGRRVTAQGKPSREICSSCGTASAA